jgi:hypothetical protein
MKAKDECIDKEHCQYIFYRRQIKGLMYEIKFAETFNKEKMILQLCKILEERIEFHDIINTLLNDELKKNGGLNGYYNLHEL